MRRKSTRAAAKASPEKPKEEKSPKKTRRHSKRHKPTSSESESEDEVLAAGIDTTAATGGELWTVTQTEQSNNDIGKIKICLARPSPATPERTERASKRLRNKPVVNMEDSPPPEEKPTRRTRRSRGGSSPVKKEELEQPQQQQPPDACDEKKGKGKSKGKHKSKIVEQAAHAVDPERTEMQSELSENVQVTAQSPQNVDISDAEIVDRDLNRCEDERSVDTNDDIVDASNNDLSNNNVANDHQNDGEPDEQSNDAEPGNGYNGEECNKPLEIELTSTKTEEVAEVEAKEEIKDEPQPSVEAKVEIKDETTSTTEIKDENIAKDEAVDSKDLVESKDVVKTEAVKEEITPLQLQAQEEMKTEDADIIIDLKCKPEVSKMDTSEIIETEHDTKIEEAEVEKIEPAEPESPEKEDVSIKKSPEHETSYQEEETSIKKSEEPVEEVKPAVIEKEKTPEPEPQPEPTPTPEKPSRRKRRFEKSPEEEPAIKTKPQQVGKEKEPQYEQEETVEIQLEASSLTLTPTPSPSKVEVEVEEKLTTTQPETEPEQPQEEDKTKEKEDTQKEEIKKPKSKVIWEETTLPNILLVTASKLLEIYPTLTLVDESSVKLESTPRERRQHEPKPKPSLLERRVSKEEKSAAVKLEREDSTTSISTEASSIALNRKISIVEDEASSLKPPPSPPKHERSSVLFITNLVRPFTVKQLRGLLERTGKIVEGGFWTDRIKSKCYVQYETEEEAEGTRNAIHGVLWPIGNGKKLIIDFATIEDLETAKNPPVIAPAPVAVTKSEPEKENGPPPNKPSNMDTSEEKVEVPPQWDEKETIPRGRSASVDNKRRHSPSRRSRTPTEVSKKKRREEPTQQRAMDDLFRKTEAMPSIYWLALQPEEIALKQQQRLERMEAHKRKMDAQSRPRRNNDRQRGGGGGGGGGGGPYRRRY